MSLGEIEIEYFAVFKEATGKSREKFTLETGDTPAKVFLRLAKHYNFHLQLDDLRIAINDEFSSIDLPLKLSDKLVFIPPVAGG